MKKNKLFGYVLTGALSLGFMEEEFILLLQQLVHLMQQPQRNKRLTQNQLKVQKQTKKFKPLLTN